MGFNSAFKGSIKRTMLDESFPREIHPWTDHEGSEKEKRHGYTLSFTPALDGGRWSTLCPGRCIPRNYPVSIAQEGRSGRVRTISSPSGFNPRTAQPLTSRSTDYDIPPPLLSLQDTLHKRKDQINSLVNIILVGTSLEVAWRAYVTVRSCSKPWTEGFPNRGTGSPTLAIWRRPLLLLTSLTWSAF